MEVTHDTNLQTSTHSGRMQERQKQQKGREDFIDCGISLDQPAQGDLGSIPNTPDTLWKGETVCGISSDDGVGEIGRSDGLLHQTAQLDRNYSRRCMFLNYSMKHVSHSYFPHAFLIVPSLECMKNGFPEYQLKPSM